MISPFCSASASPRITNIIIHRALFTMLCLAALIPSGCRTVIDDAVELQFDEKIVIQGFLQAGKPLAGIAVSRTLPPLATVKSPRDYWADNAVVSIAVDGRTIQATARIDSAAAYDVQTQKTIKIPNQLTYGIDGMTVQSGKTYTITVQWNGKTAQAQTTVPRMPTLLDSMSLLVRRDTIIQQTGFSSQQKIVRANYIVTASVQAVQQEVYMVTGYATDTLTINGVQTTFMRAGLGATYFGYPTLRLAPDVASGVLRLNENLFTLVEGYIFPTGGSGGGNRVSRVYAVLQVFDAPFEALNETIGRNTSSAGNPFSTGGANARWNVTGDGIGAFIGMAVREVPLALL
jgi:hypothetical protein